MLGQERFTFVWDQYGVPWIMSQWEGSTYLHTKPQILIHLRRVRDQSIRHRNLVRRAGHGQDERLLRCSNRRAEMPLSNDLVDVTQIFG